MTLARSRLARWTTWVAGAAVAATPVLAAVPAHAAGTTWVADPASYVSTLAGTGSGGAVVGSINNFPGPSAPFGMVQFSPDNPGTGQGYYYDNSTLRGFGLNHASQGCGAFGDFPVLPTTVSTATADKPWASTNSYTHTGEVGRPGYYKLVSTDGAGKQITSELTATTRTGVATFTFPSGVTPEVFVRPGASNTSPTAATLKYDPATGVLTGSTTTGRFCGKNNTYTAYFAMKFDQPVTGNGTWDESTTTAGSTSVDNKKAGGYVSFAAGTTTVRAAIALSYTGTAGALANLAAEVPTLGASTFSDVRDATYADWNERLAKIQVSDTASTADVKTFYHTLYRSLLHPNAFDDADGTYLGFETTPQLHHLSEHPGQERQYAQFSDWDTYRTLAPLQAILFPDEASDMAQSLVNDAEQSGSYPRWAFANASTNQMSGDNATALIAQTYAFGARDFDVDTALEYMVKGAVGDEAGTYTGGTNSKAIQRPAAKVYNDRGFAPQIAEYQTDHAVTGASITQEFSIDDFTIAQLASALGKDDVATRFTPRAQYWQNLFNPTTGFVSPRDVNGKFPAGDGNVTPTDFGYRGTVTGYGQVGFDEGMAEQYLWLEPQNMQGLITALGGREATADRLDAFMTNGLNVGANKPYMNAGNEPNFQTPWVYDYLGQPWRTSEVVDQIRTTLFGSDPHGAEPGNDDLGAQASWYVWAAIGLFPTTPGSDLLTVNTPAFDAVRVHAGDGGTIDVTAPGATTKRYTADLAVDGTSQTATYVEGLVDGADHTVAFTTADEPSDTWGTGTHDAPPSFDEGGAAVAVATTPAWPTALVGGSTALTLDVQRFDQAVTQADVQVTSTRHGLDVTSPGTVSLDDQGHATVSLAVDVADDAAEGAYPVKVSVTAGGQVRTEETSVKVAAKGSLASFATVVGTASQARQDGAKLDNEGNSYRRDLLAEHGLTPGATFTIPGDAFAGITAVWPDTAEGSPDAVVPSGQTVRLAASARKITFVGAARNGPASAKAAVTFDDGSHALTDLTLSDWVLPSSGVDNTVVAAMDERNARNSGDRTAYVFATTPYTAPEGRRIVSVTLPSSAKERVFAIGTDTSGAPAVQVASPTVTAGTALTVTGSGFLPGDGVRVEVGTAAATATAASDGTFTTKVVTPVRASGTTDVTATGDNGLTASTTVQVTGVSTSITAPGHAQPRSAVAFTGAGFQAGEHVAVTLSGASVTVTAAADGTATGTIAVPAAAGVYELKATGESSHASAHVEVTVDPAADPAIAAPSRSSLGATVTVAGSSFAPSSDVRISLANGSTLVTARTDAKGAFTAKLVVPVRADLVGRVQLWAQGTATDGTSVRLTRPITFDKAVVTLGKPALSRTSSVYGASTRAVLSVPVTGATSGKVTFRSGSKVLGTASVGRSGSSYRASLTLPTSLAVGSYTDFSASIATTATTAAASSATLVKVLKVSKAAPSSVKVSGKAFKKSSKPKVSVTVGKLTNGSYAVGKVKVYVNGKAVKTASLKSSAHGKVSVTLPKASKTIKVKATFVPSDTKNVSSKSSKTVKVSVKK
ncbi:GH92 family glycosyl hydrolase [Cellulomonas sp. HZM]|uniref:GH92 family glycosyl hydrolase n=1 Tax=Cellulomonas sp. HZM TaxID=1454010 RepID=UPI000690BFE9|nr:GH92 family glycosyl hydrolase [Cellulomonas sp. HZM]